MKDEDIVLLYIARKNEAIQETKEKYNNYLLTIANNIVPTLEDGEECVSDTYLAAWNSIPPHLPAILSSYLAKLTRRISVDCYRFLHRQKRSGTEYTLSLEELADCIPSNRKEDQIELLVEQRMDAKQLTSIINSYLRELPVQKRKVFVCRYFYHMPVKDIASCYSMGESKVKMMLLRCRKELKEHLEQEGIIA